MVFTGLNQKTTIYLALMSGVSLKAAEATFAQLTFGQKVKLTTTMLKEQALAWLMTPMGMATAAVAGISLLIHGISKYNQKLEENRQKLIEVGQQAGDHNKQLNDLIEQYRKLGEDGSINTADQETAKQIQSQIVDLVGNHAKGLDLVNGKYDEQIEKLQKIKDLNYNDVYQGAKAATENLIKGFYDKGVEGAGYTIMGGGYQTKSESEVIKKAIVGSGLEKYLKDDGGVYKFSAASSSPEEMAETFYAASELASYIAQNYKQEIQDSKGALYDFYNELNEFINNNKEDVEAYSAAIKNLHLMDAQADLAKYLKTVDIDSQGAFDNYIKSIENSTEYSDAYKKVLIDVANDAFPQFAKKAQDAGEKANEMTVSIGELEGASDKIKTLGTAFKELSEDGYITTKTLGEIQTATGLSGDEWTEYQNKLMSVKAGSSEFNQIMSDLTYKILDNAFASKDLNNLTEEQIAAILRENGVVNASAVAHDWLRMAKAKSKLATFDFSKATQEEVEDLYEELRLLGLTETAIKKLSKAYAEAQAAMLKIADEGIKTRLKLNDAELAGIQSVAEAYAKLNNKGYDYDGDGTIDITQEEYDKGAYDPNSDAAKQYKADREALVALGAAREEINNIINSIDTTPPKVDYSGAAKDKSDKNEALDNYLKDAENRYKIHQDETKYIQELQHAYDNLTKNEKERLDITGKINEAYRDLADNRIKDIEHQIDLAKELNEYADVTDYYKQIQKVSHEEADRLRAMGYDDNSSEIQDLQKTWWDAQKSIAEARKEAMEKSIDDIEDYINARNHFNDWDAYGDSEVKAIQRQTKIIEDMYNQRLLSYEEYIDKLEEQSKRIYSLGQDEVNKQLSNIDKYIDARNHYNDWDAFGDSETSAIKRQLEILDEAYRLNLISLEEYTEKTEEYTQKLYSVAKNNIVETISELVEDYEEMKNLASSQLESQKTLLQSYYNVTNAVDDAQRQINKELSASQSMYEYLNEETRKLLFNQEDYNALNKELLDIQSAADALQEQYNNDILNATEETIAEITSQYQMQYDTMMKQYEIAKAELDVAKKRQKLDNVLAERNTRMFINGQWQWVAKTQDVINAQNELADAEINRKKQEASLEQTEAINSLTTQINSIETDLAQVRKYWEDMQEMLNGESDEVAKALQEISQVSSPELKRIIEATGGSVDSFSTSLSANTKTMSDVITENLSGVSYGVSGFIANLTIYSNAIMSLANEISNAKSSSSSSVSDIKAQMAANSAAWHTASESEKKRLEQENQKLGKSIGSTYNSATGTWTHKYAKGTRYTPNGKVLMGEEGFEAFITNNGRLIPINQPTVGNIGAGGIVFNREQMANLRNLWDLSNLGKISPFVSSSSSSKQSTVIDNSIHINGLTVGEQGNEDWINGLRRYVATHK